MPNYSFKSLNLRTLEGKHYYHHFQMKLKKRINSLKGHEREVFQEVANVSDKDTEMTYRFLTTEIICDHSVLNL